MKHLGITHAACDYHCLTTKQRQCHRCTSFPGQVKYNESSTAVVLLTKSQNVFRQIAQAQILYQNRYLSISYDNLSAHWLVILQGDWRSLIWNLGPRIQVITSPVYEMLRYDTLSVSDTTHHQVLALMMRRTVPLACPVTVPGVSPSIVASWLDRRE